MGLGLLRGDPALVDQALHPGVVLGDLVEPAVAQQVGAGVADVDHAHPLAGPEHRGEGAAHAFELRVLLDHLAQALVGALHGVVQQGEQVGARDVLVEADDRAEDLGGRDLTGRRPAHAVGDGEQPGPGVAGVLVALTDQTLVGPGGEAQHEAHSPASFRSAVAVVATASVRTEAAACQPRRTVPVRRLFLDGVLSLMR